MCRVGVNMESLCWDPHPDLRCAQVDPPRKGEGCTEFAALVPLDLQQPLQPLAHGLLQIVVRPPEGRVAAGQEIVLLLL